MAVIWTKTVGNTCYEVRTAGQSRRLYTNGVHHSQYHPGKLTTNGIWDLLAMPVFFYPPASIKRVLVLGVGGGSVLHLLHNYIQPEDITGVEISPVHLSVARKFFSVTKSVAKLVRADAIDWITHYDGAPFDLIIDDLYGDKNGEPVRAVELDAKWFNTLNRNLTNNGMLVVNTIGPNEFKKCAYFHNSKTYRLFKSAYRLSLPLYDNCIGAFLKSESSIKQLHRNISILTNSRLRRELQGLDVRLYKSRRANPGKR